MLAELDGFGEHAPMSTWIRLRSTEPAPMGSVTPTVLDGSLAANPGLSLDQPWGQLGPGLEAPEICEAKAAV